MNDGLLRLRLGRDAQGRTRLLERRQRYPLTTTAVLPLAGEPGGLIYVQNAAGSVFGGDRLHLDVALAAGADLCLSTPSATRLQGDTLSVQTAHYAVAQDAFLESIPDLLIPHPRAMHRQHTAIDLAPGAGAILAETLAPGRVARGERHVYRSIALRLEVSVQGRPVLHDAATLEPAQADPAMEGALGCEGYVGTLFALAPGGRHEELAASIAAALATVPGIYGGASPLACGHGAVARVLAGEAPSLRAAMYQAWDAARRFLRGRPAGPAAAQMKPMLRKESPC
jgi:urease accessory protein